MILVNFISYDFSETVGGNQSVTVFLIPFCRLVEAVYTAVCCLSGRFTEYTTKEATIEAGQFIGFRKTRVFSNLLNQNRRVAQISQEGYELNQVLNTKAELLLKVS